jgi:histidinol phosphatase-like PHP family hydrolase
MPMIYDFHTHTFLSDGTLSPLELIRRSITVGYKAIAITDHVGLGSLERVIREVAEDCRIARECWDIIAIPGIELTHLPPQAITQAAQQAKELGAWLVLVHGETITEPVDKGTNLVAVQSPHVDILAHPGQLTPEEAKLAALNGIFVEISAREGHALSNEHITSLAQKTGAQLLLNSDAHDDKDLLTPPVVTAIAQGAGLKDNELHQILLANPIALLIKLPLPQL